MKRVVAVDFETEPIEPRPDYPPRPVGVAIVPKGDRGRYMAWGHPEGNDATLEDGRIALAKLWRDEDVTLVFHHSKFDLDVAQAHVGLAPPAWERVHDTMILAFLDDPYASTLGLKELAAKRLNEPPAERDELRDWIVANVPEAKAKKTSWGRWICKAPVRLVAPYAIGDGSRTLGLFGLLHDLVVKERGMKEPYDRERRLVEVLMRSERAGVPVDVKRLKNDIKLYGDALGAVDRWVGERLKKPELNLDERDELADAIDAAGFAVNGWLRTPTGKRSTARGSLEHALEDALLLSALAYRGSLATCLRTFMQPWLVVAERTDGLIHTTWHSTRGDTDNGARTGRLSSTPNLQNIPVEFETEQALFDASKFFDHVKLPPLPQVRGYIVSKKGRVLCGRDYSGQELRVLGHFEDGVLAGQYRADPKLDPHLFVSKLINERFGLNVTRRAAKTLNFLKVYGGGTGKLAANLGIPMEQAQRIMSAYLSVFPGLKALNSEMRRREQAKQPIRTLGGRYYFAEPPRIIKGQLRSFGYKLLNYLVQGSSADMTKEAVLRYDAARGDSRLLLTVHDEILIEADRGGWKVEMKKLKDAMESIALDVPIVSEGEYGARWTEMKETA